MADLTISGLMEAMEGKERISGKLNNGKVKYCATKKDNGNIVLEIAKSKVQSFSIQDFMHEGEELSAKTLSYLREGHSVFVSSPEGCGKSSLLKTLSQMNETVNCRVKEDVKDGDTFVKILLSILNDEEKVILSAMAYSAKSMLEKLSIAVKANIIPASLLSCNGVKFIVVSLDLTKRISEVSIISVSFMNRAIQTTVRETLFTSEVKEPQDLLYLANTIYPHNERLDVLALLSEEIDKTNLVVVKGEDRSTNKSVAENIWYLNNHNKNRSNISLPVIEDLSVKTKTSIADGAIGNNGVIVTATCNIFLLEFSESHAGLKLLSVELDGFGKVDQIKRLSIKKTVGGKFCIDEDECLVDQDDFLTAYRLYNETASE